MNVVISNKKKDILSGLGIEIIKEIDGEFTADEIIETFKNFFFQRMILDITAIKNYTDIKTIQKLSLSLDMSKSIILLDENSNTITPEYMSKLISLGIYNFTTNLEGIMYLYNSPNSYRDVAHLHIIDQNISSENKNDNSIVNKIVNKIEKPIANNNSNNNTFVVNYYDVPEITGNKIIGIKNVTKQTGATTLTYMLKRMLEKQYSVLAVEVEKSDFRFFNDRELVSTIDSNIANIVNKNKNKDVILIDVNNSSNAMALCDEIIYLIEPSMVKLNRLMVVNPTFLRELQSKKVVLNQSLLDSNSVSDFENESKLNIFYNIPPLDERLKYLPELIDLLHKLGFSKVN